jgi:hypothetical protein
MATSSFGKAFQRRLYSVLLDRSTVFALIVLTGFILVSTLNFGEAWLEWSADKYAAVFNHFSDNVAGRSLQVRKTRNNKVSISILPSLFFIFCRGAYVNTFQSTLSTRGSTARTQSFSTT